MKIYDKNIIVTGAANGIGRELVHVLLRKGAHVLALDINQQALAELNNVVDPDYKKKLTPYAVDVTDLREIEVLRDQIVSQFNQIDGLINNAGIIQPFVKLHELAYRDIDRVMEVNFQGCLFMTKAFLPYLLKSPSAHLINTSSMGGFLPVPGQAIYGAAKAAVKLMTEGLIEELKNTNVKVSVVYPGAVGTNIMKNSGLTAAPEMETSGKSAMILTPQKAAQQIIKGIEKDKTRIFVGKDSKIMNLIYRLNAGFASNLVGKQMTKLIEN
jgi:short-subunit dehydrogenase